MKRLLYLFAFLAFTFTINACKKGDDPAPVSPAVGTWSLDRVRYSGFTGAYASENSDDDATAANFPVKINFTIKGDADKTFQSTTRLFGKVGDSNGTWDLSGNDLKLNYSDGSDQKLTLDTSAEPNKLMGPVSAVSDTLTNPTTKKDELVKYNVQFVYAKQR